LVAVGLDSGPQPLRAIPQAQSAFLTALYPRRSTKEALIPIILNHVEKQKLIKL
jgi:hypothetical protein